MSLQLLARTLSGDEAVRALERARAIADALGDETLRVRQARRAQARVAVIKKMG